MTIRVHVFSDSKRLRGIRDLWDGFVEMHTDNPILLSGFVEEFMESARLDGWTPLILIILADESIVGIAPLMTRRKFGIRYARFLHYLTHFVASDGYTDTCVSRTLDFLFRTVRCQFVELTLPAASSYTAALKHEFHEKKIHSSQLEGMGQCIIPVRGTWHEFAKSKGKKLLQDIRRTERNLGHVGRWRCLCFEQSDRVREVYRQMMRIDRMSWKQSVWTRMGRERDKSLPVFWNGWQRISKAVADFKCRVWFLEVSDRMVAYVLFFIYKNVGFALKSSYDQEFAKFGPGIYLMNVAIRELFEEERVKKIDFISDAPYTKTWTSMRLRRLDFTMTSGMGISRITVALFREGEFGAKFGYGIRVLARIFRRAGDIFPLFDLFLDPNA